MTSYLLDTTTLIDFSKGREPTRSRLLALIAAGETVAVCSVSVAEFFAGLPPARHPVWQEFFAALVYWEADRDTAIQAGAEVFVYARRGTVLSTTDALIAALARAHDAVLVTSNQKHYPMPDLRLLSLHEEQGAPGH